MKPEYPERIRVWQNELNQEFVASFPGDLCVEENSEYIRLDLHKSALLEAHQSGRREGMEETARAAAGFRDDNPNPSVYEAIAAAIRAKAGGGDMNMREIMARAYDAEDAAQIGEPSPWSVSDRDPEWEDDRKACAQAALSALKKAGFVVVPVEPTEDMSNASTATPQVRDIDWVSALLGTGISSAEDVVLASYRAMIQAARDGE